MPTRKVAIGVLFLLFGRGSHGQQPIRSVLLPVRAATKVHEIRGGEGFARTGWVPAKKDLDNLEINLSQVTGLNAKGRSAIIRLEHPEQYFASMSAWRAPGKS